MPPGPLGRSACGGRLRPGRARGRASEGALVQGAEWPVGLLRAALALVLVGAVCLAAAANQSGKVRQRHLKVISADLEAQQPRPLYQGRHQSHGDDGRPAHEPLASPLASSAAEKPRLIPLVAADSGYGENSSVNVLCTVSQGHHDSLRFDWFKDGHLLGSPAPPEEPDERAPKASNSGPQIEKHSDHSLLRISRVQLEHSGRYTCSAKSQFGQDSSSVNLIVNVRLQWLKEPPKEVVVSLNQELKVDCLAGGEPKPSMRWERLDSSLATFGQSASSLQPSPSSSSSASTSGGPASARRPGPSLQFSGSQSEALAGSTNGAKNQLASTGHFKAPTSQLVSSSRWLSVQRARESDSGLYECIASNSRDADLRKLVLVQVRGPPKILPIATADSYPEGSSINLICTVSGGQRRGLSLSWTLAGHEVHELGRVKHLQGFENVAIGQDDSDISILKIRNATSSNSAQYTCTASNPLGQDSTSVKININVDMKWTKAPKDQLEVGLNQELLLECDAIGSPQPTISWFRHTNGEQSQQAGSNATVLLAKSKQLRVARVENKDSGLYECVAQNGAHDDLRKVIQVKVRGPPKILPIATADSYPEGSTINLICTVSGGQRKGLSLGWMKDGEDLSDESLRYLHLADNLSIEKTGVDISILRISNATHANSGRFTCTARNPLGEDSTSVNIVINVELKWNKLPVDTEVGLNQDVSIECDAIGQPQPQVSWTRHPSSLATGNNGTTNKATVVSQSKVLKLVKAQHKDSGLYECVARNGVDQDLRRIIQVKVRGK